MAQDVLLLSDGTSRLLLSDGASLLFLSSESADVPDPHPVTLTLRDTGHTATLREST